MILTKRPLAVVFLTMAAVIILYRLYTGTSDDYIAVDPSFHATGAVESVEESGGKYTVTLGDVEVVRGTYAEPGKKLLLYVKSDNQKISNISSHGQQAGQLNPYNYSEALKESNDKSDNIQNNESGLKIGNIIEVTGTAEAFEKAGNPGQFDAYSYYLGKGYAYKVFVESCLVIDAGVSYREYLRNMGDYCTAIFERYLPENEAGILSAMMFGRRSLLSEDDRELYKKNGLMHILAVSGMHIETVSLIFLFVITRLPVNFRVGRACLFVMLMLYGIITGFGVSCIRAVIMCGLKILAELVGRTYDVISALSFAAVITLLINPCNLFRCDFILSYLAVAAIAVVYPVLEESLGMRESKKGLFYNMVLKPLLFGVCVNITTLPVILYFYYDAALYSVLTGLVIIPMMSVLFVTGCLCVVTGGMIPAAGMFFAGGIHYILSFYGAVCDWCMDYFYDLRITGFSGMTKIILCYIIMAVIVCAARLIKNRRICAVLCAAFVVIPVFILSYRKHDGLKITFMDVGQGDGIVMCMPDGKTVCVDGGSSEVSGLAKYRIEPFLNHEGIRHIDYWIVTHMDSDHYSGLKELLERRRYNGITIDNIVISDTEICRSEFFAVFSGFGFNVPVKDVRDNNSHAPEMNVIDLGAYTPENNVRDRDSDVAGNIFSDKPEIIYMDDKYSLSFGDAILRCLNPVSRSSPHSPTDVTYDGQNESSIVLELSYGGFDALLTGDIEGGAEEELSVDTGKRYELLKVAHHGSKNSTSNVFLEKLQCDNAVISYGKDNRYGHPHAETLERLSMRGIHIYKTAESGAVTVSVREGRYVTEEYNPLF